MFKQRELCPWIKRVIAFLGCLALLLPLVTGAVSAWNGEMTVIRVGRFPYGEQLRRDSNGNYSGYGYDYLEEIARFTGWHYEFVDKSWGECLSMLERGELDLMGAVMRSPQREERFDFSEKPMISGYGVLVTTLENERLPYEDFQAFDGLKVGSVKGSQQTVNFLSYAEENGFTSVIQEYDTDGALEAALETGEISAGILTNVLRSHTLRVVATFGENSSYFATTKGNHAVLNQLDEAMRQIFQEDPFFNGKLDQKHYDIQATTIISFTREELEFIKNAPPIPCVYIPDAIPFNYYDGKEGTVQGIAPDICKRLEAHTGLRFSWIQPASASEAVEMLRDGRALVLPAKYADSNWARQNGLVLTTPYLSGQMVMISGRRTDRPEVVALYDQDSQSRVVAETVSRETQIKQYDTVLDCMEAVLNGEADTTYVNSTIATYFSNGPRYAQLQSTPLYGFAADVAMAVSGHADPMLLSVLNKGLRSISSTEISQSVLTSMKKEQAGPLTTYLYFHPVETVLLVAAAFLVLVVVLVVMLHLLLKGSRAMRKALYTDGLTGMPNYRAFGQRAKSLMGDKPEGYVLIYLDIHHFKVINDTFGYEAGDQVLITIAEALSGFVEEGEDFARIHADTFVLLLKQGAEDGLQRRLDSLADLLGGLHFAHSDAIKPLFCGGVYPLPADFDSIDKACDRANYAKDSISHHFSNTFVFYDDVMRHRALAEKELESSMYPALERGEFIAYYQPKVDTITGKVAGAEALIRWQHPEKGHLSPASFLPFYEKNGFIVKIDVYIFERVCRDLRQWLERGSLAVPVSVNFSRRHIQDLTLPKRLKDIADRYEIPTWLLEIEITETEELESVEVAVDFVQALKAYGFAVSIDDYGTGYSSISFLQQLPLNALKLDRKFILNAMKSDKARDIMRSLVSAMHKNAIRVVCEGVETQEQRDFILALNCRFIQGFFYSVPLCRDEFEAYMLAHGVEGHNDGAFLPMVNLEQRHWTGAEDFLTKSMPSWVVCCYVEPGNPVQYISPSFLEGLGYSELEFSAATDGLYNRLVHPDDLDGALELPHQTRDANHTMTLEYRIRRKDGGYLWVREVNKALMSEEGRTVLLGVCTNVTDIVHLQQERAKLIETIPGGICTLCLTEEGPVIQQATQRFYDAIGRTPEELEALDNRLFAIIHKRDLPGVVEIFTQKVANGDSLCECTFRVCDGSGRARWLTFRGAISQQERSVTVIAYNSDSEMQAEQNAARARTKLELALSLTGQAVLEYDINTKTISSHSGFAVYGIPNEVEGQEFVKLTFDRVVHPDDHQKVQDVQMRLEQGEEKLSYEIRIHSKFCEESSPYIWVRVTVCTLFDRDRRPSLAIGVMENVDQKKHYEQAFLQEAQYRRAFTETSLMAFEMNLTRDTLQRITGSRGFRLQELCDKLGGTPAQYSALLLVAAENLVVETDRAQFLTEMSRQTLLTLYQSGVREKELEYRRMTLDGEEKWNSVWVCMLLDQLTGDVMGYAYHRDIQERKALEHGAADRDPLTKLLNRSSAEDQIQQFLLNGMSGTRLHAFLMLDLDRFKMINDTCGHLMGDKCLMELARILTTQVRDQDIVARMGGDEFAVLLKNLPDEGQAIAIAEKLSDAVARVGEDLSLGMQTGVSIGIAFVPRHGTEFEQLYRTADKAMYRAKGNAEIAVAVSAEYE